MPAKPSSPSTALDLWDQMYADLGKRLGLNLFDEVMRHTPVRRRFTLARLLALGMALAVYGLALLLLGAGLWLLLAHWRNFAALFVAVVLILLAYLARPRVPKQQGTIQPRAAIPTFYQLADQVADALGVAPVYGIIIDERFNAGYAHIGWRQQRVMRLGLPLLAVLDAQETVALLTHELAHELNADPAHHILVNSARLALLEWYDVVRPRYLFGVVHSGTLIDSMVAISETLSNILLLVLSALPWLGLYLLSHVLWHDSQRAEYLADYWAAQVGGTETTKVLLNKLRSGDTLNDIVREAP